MIKAIRDWVNGIKITTIIITPDKFSNEMIGELNSRGGQIIETSRLENSSVKLKVKLPLKELCGSLAKLHSIIKRAKQWT